MLKHRVRRIEALRKRCGDRGDGAKASAAAVPHPPIDLWAQQHLPGYFSRPFSLFHHWLVGQLRDLHQRRGTRLALVAPRGSAKSTWVSLAYPLWAAIHRHEPYIQLISDSQSQARLLLEALKREVEDNPALADAYPAAAGRGRVWGQDRIRLANGVVVEALGTGAKIRGRRNRAERPSLIVVDDPENDGHVTSALQRERSWSWFNRAVANAGTPQTNVLVLGTALHRDCLVLRLTRTAGWRAQTFRASSVGRTGPICGHSGNRSLPPWKTPSMSSRHGRSMRAMRKRWGGAASCSGRSARACTS